MKLLRRWLERTSISWCATFSMAFHGKVGRVCEILLAGGGTFELHMSTLRELL